MPHQTPSPHPKPLPKVLGFFDTTMMAMGGMIGAGIFFTPHEMAKNLPSLQWILIAWAIGGFIAMTGAFLFAELGAMLPRAGGQYVFLKEGLGPFPAFLFGWMLLTVITPGALALVADVCVDHLYKIADRTPPLDAGLFSLKRGVGLFLLALVTWINIRGVKLGAIVQNSVMLAKIGGILFLVVLGIHHGVSGTDSIVPVVEETPRAVTRIGFAAAMMSVGFSYGGWQNVCAIAGEVKNPHRNLPLGILVGTVIVIILYITVNWAFGSVLGIEGIKSSRTFSADMAEAVVGDVGSTAIAVLIVISTLGIIQALQLMTPRIYYAMSVDGLFFESVGRLHPKYLTPALAIAIQGIWACVLLMTNTASTLIESVVFADWVFFFLGGLAFFRLRVRQPDLPRPYRAFGYPWIPGIFVLASVGMVVGSIASANKVAIYRGLLFFCVGSLAYLFWAGMKKRKQLSAQKAQ